MTSFGETSKRLVTSRNSFRPFINTVTSLKRSVIWLTPPAKNNVLIADDVPIALLALIDLYWLKKVTLVFDFVRVTKKY